MTQLLGGIRYFDLRITTRPASNKPLTQVSDKFFLTHAQYAKSVVAEFLEIRSFLQNHSREVVIIDCHHFYGLSDQLIGEFEQVIEEIFGDMLIPSQSVVPSLAEIWERKQQVLVIIQRWTFPRSHRLWSGWRILQPWPKTADPQKLAEFLASSPDKDARGEDRFYVHQGILNTNARHFLSNLGTGLKQLSKKANTVVDKWLTYPPKVPGPNGVNIVITDFSISRFPHFASKVIAINWAQP
nr:unnamed protein product [Spirometra erinaceieuropaei]